MLEEGTLIGTKNVELYLTENGGEKWFHYGTDQDASSPMEVEVPGDGTYGFTIRVRNDMGLAEIPPQPGEHPDLTVTVDQTPPTAELHPPRQVRAHRAINLCWNGQSATRNSREVPLPYLSVKRRTVPGVRLPTGNPTGGDTSGPSVRVSRRLSMSACRPEMPLET